MGKLQTVPSPATALHGRHLPRLETGDHLDQATFHARYAAMPPDFRAELIGGVVFVPSPLRLEHDVSHALVMGVYSLASGLIPQPCSDSMAARSWPHCSTGSRRQSTPRLSSSSRHAAAPCRARSHGMAPRQVTRRAAWQTKDTRVATSFCAIVSYTCNDRFALVTIAVRSINPVDTLAAPSH
jgi:hypothetical protein